MANARLNECEIAYLDEGDGEPILLIHGFASNRVMNWTGPRWVAALKRAGYRVIAHDNRGHGESTKFYREQDYSLEKMASDAIELLDYLSIYKCHIMGYSMGARITATLVAATGDRFLKTILGGNGYAMVEGAGHWESIRDALLADSLSQVSDPAGRAYREFAEQTGSDLRALAACAIGMSNPMPEEIFAAISGSVLVAVGTDDAVAGSPHRLINLMSDASYLPIPGRDHMRAVGDKAYLAGVIDFLEH